MLNLDARQPVYKLCTSILKSLKSNGKEQMKTNRRENKKPNHFGTPQLLVLILLVAAFFRFYAFPNVPPGFQFDEAYNAFDALRVLNGEYRIFFEANGGREPFYTYLQALFIALLDPTPSTETVLLGLRLASAFAGLVTVVLVYGITRTLFPKRDRAAWLAALVLAISLWHVHFSRYGIRAITLPLFLIGSLWAFWVAVEKVKQSHELRKAFALFGLSGMLTTGAVYAHPAGRLIPLILVAFTAYLLISERNHRRIFVSGLFWTGTVAFLCFIPLGYYFWKHPESFFGHPGDVSIFDPRVHGGNPVRALFVNILKVAGMFFIRGDEYWIHNLPGRPALDVFLVVPFLMGLVAVIKGVTRKNDEQQAWILSVIWMGVMLLPTLLSDMAPNFSRAMGALPVLVMWTGIGVDKVWAYLEKRIPRLAPVISIGLLVGSGLLTFRDYFIIFPSSPGAYYAYDVDKIEAATLLRRLSTSSHVYLAPLWAEHATIAFLTRDLDLRTFEAGDTLALPFKGQGGAVYAFPPEQEYQVEVTQKRLGPLATHMIEYDDYGNPLLVLLHVEETALPDALQPLTMLQSSDFPWHLTTPLNPPLRFRNGLELLGYRIENSESEDVLRSGSSFSVVFAWRATQPIEGDYIASVRLIDAARKLRAQIDKQAGHYPTSQWRTDEIILVEYPLTLTPCTPSGTDYELVTTLYRWPDGEPLPLSSGRSLAVLGALSVEWASSLSLDVLNPPNSLDFEVGPWRIIGYGIESPGEVMPLDPLKIALYVQSEQTALQWPDVQLCFRSQNGQVACTAFPWPSASPPMPGRGTCVEQGITVPGELSPGTYILELATDEGASQTLTSLEIQPSVRQFDVPVDVAHTTDVRFGSVIALRGYEINRTTPSTLEITLVWQALERPSMSYTAFVHLLDPNGQIIAQKDTPPKDGTYSTDRWVSGEIVIDKYTLEIPADLLLDNHVVEVGFYDPVTLERLPAYDLQGDRLSHDRALLEVP